MAARVTGAPAGGAEPRAHAAGRALAVTPGAAWAAFAVALAALAISLAIRAHVSVWTTTAIAACVGVLAAAISSGRDVLRRLLAPSRWISAAVVTGIALTLATHVAYRLGTVLIPGLEARVSALYAELLAPPGPRAAVPVLVLVVVAEELVFRGLLVTLLERCGLRRAPLIGLATALYVLPQLAGGSPVLVGLAAALGTLWTWQRIASGTIAVPLITHLLWDLSVFVIAPLPVAT